ncbi:hypothetical protein RB597_006179 [Gaeumannomyces tritici]
MEKTKPSPPMHLRRSFEVRLVRERGEPHVDFHFYDHNDGYAIVWELLLGKKGDRRVGAGRLLDHEWIDLELLRSWKQKCLATHGDESSNPFRIPQVLPAWLIDTVEKRLVPGTTAGTPAAAPPGGGQRTSWALFLAPPTPELPMTHPQACFLVTQTSTGWTGY